MSKQRRIAKLKNMNNTVKHIKEQAFNLTQRPATSYPTKDSHDDYEDEYIDVTS